MTHTATSTNTDTARCGRCGRRLDSAASRSAGYGPVCALKVRDAARSIDLTVYKPAQLRKAIALVDNHRITRQGPAWIAIGSDGTSRYTVTPYTQKCTCQAGQFGRRCAHLAAATAMAAA